MIVDIANFILSTILLESCCAYDITIDSFRYQTIVCHTWKCIIWFLVYNYFQISFKSRKLCLLHFTFLSLHKICLKICTNIIIKEIMHQIWFFIHIICANPLNFLFINFYTYKFLISFLIYVMSFIGTIMMESKPFLLRLIV